MCNTYASHVPAKAIADAFGRTGAPLLFEGGIIPNLEPQDGIRIGDTAPIVVRTDGGPLLRRLPWGPKGTGGRPVFNFRSESRSFAHSTRCLIPFDAFYEFTAAEPGQTRKTKWRFAFADQTWGWIAGLVRDNAWTMLTTSPGPDVAPYHDRQIILLRQDEALDWLDLTRPEGELLRASPAGALSVKKAFPALTAARQDPAGDDEA